MYGDFSVRSEYNYKTVADGLNVDLWRLKVMCAFSAVFKVPD
jgi:hypothetical protein